MNIKYYNLLHDFNFAKNENKMGEIDKNKEVEKIILDRLVNIRYYTEGEDYDIDKILTYDDFYDLYEDGIIDGELIDKNPEYFAKYKIYHNPRFDDKKDDLYGRKVIADDGHVYHIYQAGVIIAKNDCFINGCGNSKIYCYDNCRVHSGVSDYVEMNGYCRGYCLRSNVVAYGQCDIISFGSNVNVYGKSTVSGYDYTMEGEFIPSNINCFGGSYCDAFQHSKVVLYDVSRCFKYDNSKVKIDEASVVERIIEPELVDRVVKNKEREDYRKQLEKIRTDNTFGMDIATGQNDITDNHLTDKLGGGITW